mmetsp:Transcript_17136/g.14091  ORF Transcript_17136/g.14091 Transcript_17136/m.14091 type:complete len:118 (-) Transcript_17136:826-1179(-)
METQLGKKFYVNCNTGQMTVEMKLAKRGRGGILADEMGLGKTFMTLSLIYKFSYLGSLVNNQVCRNSDKCKCLECVKKKLLIKDINDMGGTLIVLPKSLLNNWKSEIINLLGDKLNY